MASTVTLPYDDASLSGRLNFVHVVSNAKLEDAALAAKIRRRVLVEFFTGDLSLSAESIIELCAYYRRLLPVRVADVQEARHQADLARRRARVAARKRSTPESRAAHAEQMRLWRLQKATEADAAIDQLVEPERCESATA